MNHILTWMLGLKVCQKCLMKKNIQQRRMVRCHGYQCKYVPLHVCM